MQALRRHDHTARIEMLPLIDVVFLLLTFFIFSMLVVVKLEMLTVKLAPLGTGKSVEPLQVEAFTVTIDPEGDLYLGKKQVTANGLMETLAPASETTEPPLLFIAMSKQARVDRAPVLLDLMKRFVHAGFTKYTFVGPPAQVEKR